LAPLRSVSRVFESAVALDVLSIHESVHGRLQKAIGPPTAKPLF
jgi:hypothetical protein